MAAPDEEILLARCAQGDERAFIALVHPYRQALARFIRYRIGDLEDAEDVLQETWVAAWLGLHRVREAGSVRGWLMQVARNRCRDYFRAKGRHDIAAEEQELEEYANRFGLRLYRHSQMAADIVDALESIPAAAREAGRRFYLEGLTIAEIAAETHSPPGTIKRRLFQARRELRASLGVISPQRSSLMTTQTTDLPQIAVPATAFPSILPRIIITESDETPFAVDCRELRQWSIIPLVGQWASWADYDLPGWKLTEAVEACVLHPTTVHDVEGVQIEVHGWKPEKGWKPSSMIYGRLTDEKAQFLAVSLAHENAAQMETFLDKGFEASWGEMDRALADRGDVRCEPDGSFRVRNRDAIANGAGAGLCTVDIGGKQRVCLRVLECDLANEIDTLVESFLTHEGRTVLVRRYKRPIFVQKAMFEVILDETEQIVVDGITFLHWYDTITNFAL